MIEGTSPLLEVNNLKKIFGGLIALDNITLSFYPSKLQSIIGPNGAGKTTLFNLITGMYQPTQGKVFFKGEDITNLPCPKIFSRRIVRTFQVTNIFSELSVKKNVEIAAVGRYQTSNSPWGRLDRRRGEIRELCLNYLEMLSLADKKDQEAGLLAYGDKRRLEIAMALSCQPELLLLDEPTAGMSPEETQQTAQFLSELAEEITILLVEHDMKIVMGISDRVTVFRLGKVIADGSPKEIQSNPEVQEAYLGRSNGNFS
jgi:branched-chain amino acid transport system ATP-binding protein